MTIGILVSTSEGYVIGNDCLIKSKRSRLEEKLIITPYTPRWEGDEDTACGTVSCVSGMYFSLEPFGIGGVLRKRSEDVPHIAYDMFDEEFQKLRSFELRGKSDQFHTKGNKLESIRYEGLADLKNMVKLTMMNQHSILFIGYSSERLPIAGGIKGGTCSQVSSYEIIGNGKKYVEFYVSENYSRLKNRSGLSLEKAVTLVGNALNLCLAHTQDYQGYQIAVVPNQLNPKIRTFQNLEAAKVGIDTINYLYLENSAKF